MSDGMGHLVSVGCMLATGAVVLYLFFTTLATISPLEVAGVSGIIAAAGTLLLVRALRIDVELADPAGDPELREARNRARERRGF
jgi:hypothetical protein